MTNSNYIAYSKFSSLSGTTLFNVFLNVWMVSVFGSAKELSHVLTIAGLSSFLFSFIGGYISSSDKMLNFIKISDLLSFCFCILATIFLEVAQKNHLIILVLVFLLNANVALTSPSLKRMIGIAIKKDDIVKFNSYVSLVSEVIKVTMPFVTTFLYNQNILTLERVVFINGISFFVSFILIQKISYMNPSNKEKKNGYIQVFREIKMDSFLIYLIVGSFFSNIFLAGFNLLMPVFSVNLFNNATLYGVLISTESLASIIGLASTRYFSIDSKLTKERLGLFASAFAIVMEWQHFSRQKL